MTENEKVMRETISKIKIALTHIDRMLKDLEHKLGNMQHAKQMSQQLKHHKHKETLSYKDLKNIGFGGSFSASGVKTGAKRGSRKKKIIT